MAAGLAGRAAGVARPHLVEEAIGAADVEVGVAAPETELPDKVPSAAVVPIPARVIHPDKVVLQVAGHPGQVARAGREEAGSETMGVDQAVLRRPTEMATEAVPAATPTARPPAAAAPPSQ